MSRIRGMRASRSLTTLFKRYSARRAQPDPQVHAGETKDEIRLDRRHRSPALFSANAVSAAGNNGSFQQSAEAQTKQQCADLKQSRKWALENAANAKDDSVKLSFLSDAHSYLLFARNLGCSWAQGRQ